MAQYWIKKDNSAQGPFTGTQIKELAQRGDLLRQHHISSDKKRWIRAEKVKGLEFQVDPIAHTDLGDLFDEEFGENHEVAPAPSLPADVRRQDRIPVTENDNSALAAIAKAEDEIYRNEDGFRMKLEKCETCMFNKPTGDIFYCQDCLQAVCKMCLKDLRSSIWSGESGKCPACDGICRQERPTATQRAAKSAAVEGHPSTNPPASRYKDVDPLQCFLVGSLVFAVAWSLIALIFGKSAAWMGAERGAPAILKGLSFPYFALLMWPMGQALDRIYSRANSSGRAAIDAQYGLGYAIVAVVSVAFGGFAQLIVWLGGCVMLLFGRWPRLTIFTAFHGLSSASGVDARPGSTVRRSSWKWLLANGLIGGSAIISTAVLAPPVEDSQSVASDASDQTVAESSRLRPESYQPLLNLVLTKDPCPYAGVKPDGPIFEGTPPISELRKFLNIDKYADDPLIAFAESKPEDFWRPYQRKSCYRGAIVLLGQHGPAAQDLVDDIFRLYPGLDVRERAGVRKIAESIRSMDPNVYDRLFRREGNLPAYVERADRSWQPLAIEVLDLSVRNVVEHAQQADAHGLELLRNTAEVMLIQRANAATSNEEPERYTQSLKALGTALAERMDEIEDFECYYGRTILPTAVRAAPQAVGRKLLTRLDQGTSEEFPRDYQRFVLPRLLIRITEDSIPTIERALLEGRFLGKPSDDSDIYRELEVRNGMLEGILAEAGESHQSPSEQRIIFDNIAAIAPLLKEIESGERSFGEYGADGLVKSAGSVLAVGKAR